MRTISLMLSVLLYFAFYLVAIMASVGVPILLIWVVLHFVFKYW